MEQSGVAYSVISDTKVIGCAGVILPWPRFGVAWMLTTNDLLTHRFLLLRTVPRILREIRDGLGLTRLEACVVEANKTNNLYVEWLGFTREYGRVRRYTPNDETAIRYEWIRGD
jgi:hypothetical protein